MKLIYTNENNFLVSNARNILENENIEVYIKNEFLSGAAGDLAPFDTWQELWVEDKDYDKATKLLLTLTDNKVSTNWSCPVCGEANEASFEVCWNCQKERA